MRYTTRAFSLLILYLALSQPIRIHHFESEPSLSLFLSTLSLKQFRWKQFLQIEPISSVSSVAVYTCFSIEAISMLHRSSRSNRCWSSVEDSVISSEDSDIRSSIEAPDRTDFEAALKIQWFPSKIQIFEAPSKLQIWTLPPRLLAFQA